MPIHIPELFLPDGTRRNPLDNLGPTICALMDGAPLEETCRLGGIYPPGQQPHCKILQDYLSADGHNIQYRKGMRGRYWGEVAGGTGVDYVRIMIEGLTETDEEGGNAKWVPASIVKVEINEEASGRKEAGAESKL